MLSWVILFLVKIVSFMKKVAWTFSIPLVHTELGKTGFKYVAVDQ